MKKTKHILIVEDELILNEAFQIILKKEGFKVVAAFNGQEALSALKGSKFDLVLLDLLMPVMSGEEFLIEFRKLHKDTPVIVFSNLDSQNNISSIQSLGATRYMLKSWASPKQLAKIVKDTIGS